MTTPSRMTAAEYCALMGVSEAPEHFQPVDTIPMKGLGTLSPRKMNGLEAEYAAHLDTLKLVGDVLWWDFEAVKFRLGDDCWYRPDFLVMLANGRLEAHETKGFWRDDARVKIKVAADKFPIPFVGIQKKSSSWVREVFS